MTRSGPLAGLTIVEFQGLGPGPFCAMMLADLGADIIRIDRAGKVPWNAGDALGRGRKSIAVDLKNPGAVDLVLKVLEKADGLIEGFRPGVMERLGLGPDVCLKANPKLVYGRMTGWGQDGPYGPAPGHDVNYLALSGMLWPLGPADRPPVPPLNLAADFGGGGMMLALGMVAAFYHVTSTGRGQVVDAAMVDGSAVLGTMFYGMINSGTWKVEREANMLDGHAPFYGVYETGDGKYVSIGSLEPQAAVLRRAAEGPRPRRPALREAVGQGHVARPPPGDQRRLPVEDARRMDGAARRQGNLLRARPRHAGGTGPSAQCRARHLRGEA
ncbi:MAG: CoA-transferase family III family protein 12 [Xanthobacteraceae bacterium]|nr:MAG: CoA-transferase family III family protein 12 [Xanthobacteraceae bacterium]